MTELLIGICVFLLANLFWIYKANKHHDDTLHWQTPSNPGAMDAARNLDAAIGMFIGVAAIFIVLLFFEGGFK